MKRHLLDTGLGILRIAMATGFGSSDYLAARFKKATGFSPRAYRKRFRPDMGHPPVLSGRNWVAADFRRGADPDLWLPVDGRWSGPGVPLVGESSGPFAVRLRPPVPENFVLDLRVKPLAWHPRSTLFVSLGEENRQRTAYEFSIRGEEGGLGQTVRGAKPAGGLCVCR